jgi:hypothetical protein
MGVPHCGLGSYHAQLRSIYGGINPANGGQLPQRLAADAAIQPAGEGKPDAPTLAPVVGDRVSQKDPTDIVFGCREQGQVGIPVTTEIGEVRSRGFRADPILREGLLRRSQK